MLLWGTINPTGEDDVYNGFYYTKSDLQKCVQSCELIGKPVLIEHTGSEIGTVVSAWQNSRGQMDCILDIANNNLESRVISRFINDGVCRELSLGYKVDIQNSANGMHAGDKHVVEVSVVRKGARDSCHIHAFT